ncbi:MAG: undecaprenyldiphospho-muramoylpentapeptide beta-N-acetylglucosaminyltransferase [Chloroflexia bacterium]
MRVLISGGGTGGHVYPALAVIAALPGPSQVLYTGSESGMEKHLLRETEAQVSFATVPAAALRGRAPWTLLRNLVILARGTRLALRLVKDFAPEVVLVTGGYVSIPVGLAAWRKRVPLLVYLPDVVPGLAVRFLARLATQVATSTPDAARYLPRDKVVVTGYPVRPALFQTDRRSARAHFGFSEEERVVLIYGGSRGARAINLAVAQGLPEFLRRASLIHICGQAGDEAVLRERAAGLPEDLRSRYRLYPYLHQEMPAALAAADLAICRAGASILGELPAVGLPAILVPYPYVHQEENAAFLVRHGAAVRVPNARLRDRSGRPEPTPLLQALDEVLETPSRLARMAQASRRLARPEAARALVEVLQALAERGSDRPPIEVGR